MSSPKAMINTYLFYHWDDTLFNDMSLPEGIDRQEVIDGILLRTTDFALIITDLNWLKFAIKTWSAHRVGIWEKLLETTQYEYNPIENYNRYEEEEITLAQTGSGTVKGDGGLDTTTYTGTNEGSESTVHSGNDVSSLSGTDSRNTSDTESIVHSGDDETTLAGSDILNIDDTTGVAKTGFDTTTERVSAFNETNTWSDHTQTETDYNSNTDTTIDRTEQTDYGKRETLSHGENVDTTKAGTDSTTYGKTETLTHGETISNTSNLEEEKTEIRKHESGEVTTKNFRDDTNRQSHIHGNIGVMSTQEMIEKQRAIVDFDVIDFIINDYIKEFCVMIY